MNTAKSGKNNGVNDVTSLKTVKSKVGALVDAALEESGGLLRLAPCWVPRSFLQPGKRLKLHPDDLYAFGLNRGGIDERWFASTTPAANENRTPDEGLSYVVAGGRRFTLQQAVAERGAQIIGERHLAQVQEMAGLLQILRQHGAHSASHAPERQAGRAASDWRASRSPTISRRNTTTSATISPTPSWAWNRARPRREVRRCLENWNKGDNGILDLAAPIASSPAPAG